MRPRRPGGLEAWRPGGLEALGSREALKPVGIVVVFGHGEWRTSKIKYLFGSGINVGPVICYFDSILSCIITYPVTVDD